MKVSPRLFIFLTATALSSASLFSGVSFKPRPPHSNATILSLSPILPPNNHTTRVNSSVPFTSSNHVVGNWTRVNFKPRPHHYNRTVNGSLSRHSNGHVTTDNDRLVFPDGNHNDSAFMNQNHVGNGTKEQFKQRLNHSDWTGGTSSSSRWNNHTVRSNDSGISSDNQTTLSNQNHVGSDWTRMSDPSPPLQSVNHNVKGNNTLLQTQHATQNNGTDDKAGQRRVIGAAPRCPVGKLMDDMGKCRDPM